MSDWKSISSILGKYRDVNILIHEKADGDALGSALALASILQQLGKKPQILYPEDIPTIYLFLPGLEVVKKQSPGLLEKEIPIIAVDCADEKRTAYKISAEHIVVNIDHHISNNNFGTINIVDSNAAAVGEIIYRILKEAELKITPQMATCLYVAISTDTGSFSYSNTTAETMRIASELIVIGADLDLIRKNLHEKRPLRELLTVKLALASLFISNDSKIIGSILAYDTLRENDLLNSDTDGLIALLRATEGTEVTLLFKEIGPDEIKVSLRSKVYVDVNQIASEYGGGGHARAAGCTIRGNVFDVKDNFIKKVEQYLAGGDI